MGVEVLLAAEQQARVQIDRQLTLAGWSVVDRKDLNHLLAGAVREVIMKSGPCGRPRSLRPWDRALHGDVALTESGHK